MIEKIELLGPSGEPTSLVTTGDAVSLRLHYRAKERITAPVFGVSIDTREGIFVWGLHGVDACYVPTSIEPGTELPPVSRTSKLKSREWEAFHVCGFAVEA